MSYLYERLESAISYGAGKPVPNYISDNLNPSRPLREYQKRAFQHFITHYESDQCAKPTQVLFHMATGSGKTLIMAGLMIYLFDRRALRKMGVFTEEQVKKIALYMAIFTAPYLYLLPPSLFY